MADESYLLFEREDLPNRKTPIVWVRSKSSGIILGKIVWWGRWRQFCFCPAAGTVFNDGCMSDISTQIAQLAQERYESR